MSNNSSDGFMAGTFLGVFITIAAIFLVVSMEHANAVDANAGHYVTDKYGNSTFKWGPKP